MLQHAAGRIYSSGVHANADAPLTPRRRRLNKQIQRSKELERQQKAGLEPQPQPQQLPQPPPSQPAADATGSLSLECPHFAACSGCSLDTGLNQPPVLAESQRFFRDVGGLASFQLNTGSQWQWRQRARLAVRAGPDGQAVIGLFDNGSHVASAIPSCVVHHPAINEAVQLVQQAIASCGIQPYDEDTGMGQLRYVQLTVVQPDVQDPPPLLPPAATPSSAPSDASVAQAAGSALPAVQLVLVWNADRAEDEPGGVVDSHLAALADRLWQAGRRSGKGSKGGGGSLLHSVWANFQPARNNTILGARWKLLQGAELAWARLGGADICFSPGSFMQANFGAMDAALKTIQQHVPAGSTIADLHAGVGTIGLSLAATRQPRWVRFVEINGQGSPPFRLSKARLRRQLAAAAADRSSQDAPPAAADAMEAAAATSGGDSRSDDTSSGGGTSDLSNSQVVGTLEYNVSAAGSDPARWCQDAEVVVLDPPRKGLEPRLLSWLCGSSRSGYGRRSGAAAQEQAASGGVRQLVYLSCGFPAFQRDCEELLGSGRWRLRHAEGFLFFPGTDHIETLAVFDAV